MSNTSNGSKNHKIMFVCMGNICRSPTAHAVMQYIVDAAGLTNQFDIQSAGTHAYHIGEQPDRRSQATALKHGVKMNNLHAQKISVNDYDYFDWILAMDQENLDLIEYYSPENPSAKFCLLMDFSETHPANSVVPDPYYGGSQGFEEVFSMVENACQGLLNQLQVKAFARDL